MLEASVTGKVKPIKYLCIIQYVQYSEKFEEKYDDVSNSLDSILLNH